MFSVGRSLWLNYENYDFVSVIFYDLYIIIDIDSTIKMKCLYSAVFLFWSLIIGDYAFIW